MGIKIAAEDAANALEIMGAMFENRAEHIEACAKTLSGPQTTTAIEVWRLAAEMCRDADVIEFAHLVGSTDHVETLEAAKRSEAYAAKVTKESAELSDKLYKANTRVEGLRAENASLVRRLNEARNTREEQFERMRKHNDTLIEERNASREAFRNATADRDAWRRKAQGTVTRPDHIDALAALSNERKGLIALRSAIHEVAEAAKDNKVLAPMIGKVLTKVNERLEWNNRECDAIIAAIIEERENAKL